MSEAIKLPFDPIPVGGGTATAEPPRPAFSRSAPETPTGGLLPPKKPVEKTPPVTLPAGIAPETPAPNPAPGTPPPNPAAVGGLLQDLIRPSRSKLAIAAGMVSLFAGAYGLNLVMPTSAPSDKKQMAKKDEEKKPTPTIETERTSPKPFLERSGGGIMPVGNVEPVPAPAPLGTLPPVTTNAAAPVPLPSSTAFGSSNANTLPLPEPTRPNWETRQPGGGHQRDQQDRTAAPPPNPFENKSAALPLPGELPKLPSDTSAPAPGSPFGGSGMTPVNPDTQVRGSAPLPLAGLPEPSGLPQPKEVIPANPINLSGGGTPSGGGLPALPPIESPSNLGGGVSDIKSVPLPAVPFGGEQSKSVELPKLPLPTNPAALTSNNTGTAPAPIGLPPVGHSGATKESPFKEEKSPVLVGLPGVKESPFKEEKVPPSHIGNLTPAGGSIPAAPSSVVESTPKTDFDVDLVRVRSSDTYASISEAFYGSKQYAAALRAFNRGTDLGQLREVQVPPMHVIRKQTQGRDAVDEGRGLPTGGVRGPVLDAPVQSDNPESADWGTPGKRRSSVRYEKYTTPREGMTAREVAKAVYDDEREWAKLTGSRGVRLRADDPLPRGTEITVPREELPWK